MKSLFWLLFPSFYLPSSASFPIVSAKSSCTYASRVPLIFPEQSWSSGNNLTLSVWSSECWMDIVLYFLRLSLENLNTHAYIELQKQKTPGKKPLTRKRLFVCLLGALFVCGVVVVTGFVVCFLGFLLLFLEFLFLLIFFPYNNLFLHQYFSEPLWNYSPASKNTLAGNVLSLVPQFVILKL